MVINLQGNAADLNVFRYTDKIDISQESEKVQDYFKRCYPDFVSIENDIATPTDNTKAWLAKIKIICF